MTSLPGLTLPIVSAPMAGGPGTPELAIATGRAGGMGFLAAGYKTPQGLADEIDAVSTAGVHFGVNLFVPNPLPIPVDLYRAYAGLIAAEISRYGLDVPAAKPVEDDDDWADKVDVLCARPVPAVSFTFAIPPAADLARLRATGAFLVQTVTTVDEARLAQAAGLDALVVQAPTAGGHSGTFTPRRALAPVALADLVAAVRHAVDLPLIAAGGLATPADVAAAVRAGAGAVCVGTVLLRCPEAGTTSTHRAALADPRFTGTVTTRAFTGRPARGLRNDFIDRYETRAPFGYPAIHHLTRAMRKSAAAAGDPDRLHLWAGTGFRHATADPAAVILDRLAGSL
jgi:NAD(P)H-dependent flavin oxidoreductase YrpB (nitropropane dioxygenase family)